MSDQNPPLSKVTAWLLGIVLGAALVATLVLAADVLMLIFLGLLFGIFLCQCSTLVGQLAPFSYAVNLSIVTSIVLLTTGATFLGLAMSLDSQLDEASAQLDSSVEKIEIWLESKPTIFEAVKKVPFSNRLFQETSNEKISGDGDEVSESETAKKTESQSDQKSEEDTDNDPLQIAETAEDAIRSASGRVVQTFRKMVETTFGLLANIGIIFFVGIFVAVDPPLYRDGFAKVFAVDRRDRIAEVMNLMGDSMFRWIIGRFIAMLLTGTGTAIALALLGVPMPITIGIATGLLTFIPNIGGIIALVLAALMALTQGISTVGWVVLAYGAIQLIESNVITPMIQQYQTSIPPALLIAFQLIMGVLNGFLGIMIATPLLASLLPLVKELWIKDVLETES